MCQVDDCQRRAAASVLREDLPGTMQLCFTHTEDFRMNGSAWTVNWSPTESGPISVRAAPVGTVGRDPLVPWEGQTAGPGAWGRLRTRLPGRRRG